MIRFVAIVALALCLAPRELVNQVANSAYVNGVDLVTICERRPKDCEAVAERLKETGIVLADLASRAAVELRGRIEDSVLKMRQMDEVSAIDRGTLRSEDFAPAWQGS